MISGTPLARAWARIVDIAARARNAAAGLSGKTRSATEDGLARRRARLAGVSAKVRSTTAEARIRVLEAVARRRVPLGFLSGAIVLGLAQPTTKSIAAGMSVAAVGESVRVWAAGHLNKAREVTATGPYRWLAHPLYAGSSIMAMGLAVACANVAAAATIALYVIVTFGSAIRKEEAFLRRAFGDHYDNYRRGDAGAVGRFSLKRAISNGEHRAVMGLLTGAALLLWKANG